MLSNFPTDVGVVEKAECRMKVKDKWKKGLFLQSCSSSLQWVPSCPGSHWAVDVYTVQGHFRQNIQPLERIGV